LFSFRVLLGLGVAVIAALTVSVRFNDPDLWFHLKLGQVVWTTHSIPSTDTFSFTANGHTWIAHEWLAELSIYGAYLWGGYAGLMTWLMVFGSLPFVLVYVLAYRGTGNTLMAFLGAVCAWFFGTVGLATRPHLVGFTFLAAELLLLQLAARNRRWLWLLPPVFAIWVNCHGSFFFGMGVLGVYWICSLVHGKWGLIEAEAQDPADRRLLGIIVVLCGLALLCNPVGFQLLTYPLNTTLQQKLQMQSVEEWMPPDVSSSRGLAMIAAAAAMLLVPLLRRSAILLRELLLVAAALGLALQHQRMLFVFGIVVSPVLCRLLAPLLGRDGQQEHPIANAVLMAGFMTAIVMAFPNAAGIQRQIRKTSPVAAVEYIRQAGLRGPMLNEYVFGDYLIWALPEEKVFVDGRGDVFEWSGVLAEYGRWVTLAEDPNLLLNRRGIRLCLLSKDAPMTRVLPYLSGWRKAYSDEVASVFVR
jgi:hypothetical protein